MQVKKLSGIEKLGNVGGASLPGISELATVMMIAAQRRMTVTAANVGNLSTPSYKTQRIFSQIVDLRDPMPVENVARSTGNSAHALKSTGNVFDVATDGKAMLLFRIGDGFRFASSAQLHRENDGHLVDLSGGVLQASGGGDLAIGAGAPTILRDGTVLIDGQAVGRIGLFEQPAGDVELLLNLPETLDDGVVHQGYLSPSNVDQAAEMIELSKASRLAETGARLFQIYDDLIARAATKLGELGQ